MDAARILIAVVGAVGVLLSIALSRSGRLTSGYGVSWLLIGLALLLLALVGPALCGWLGLAGAGGLLLLSALALLLCLAAMLLFQSASLARLKAQSRSLAQEIALLRSALANLPPSGKDSRTGDAEDESPVRTVDSSG